MRRLVWRLLLAAAIAKASHPACNNRGHLEHGTKRCICSSGYHGPDCSLKYCPFGIAWTGVPTAQDTVHTRKAECSNMGICDRSTGTCQCRHGFEGPACERLWCPRTGGVDCSGHGRCVSLSQAGAEWDGVHLVREPERKEYDNPWDAGKMFGCICNEGWIGFDCSLRQCPLGYDGVEAEIKHESLIIFCQADAGHFSVFKDSAAIRVPFDATASDLKRLLETTLPIQSATVEILGSSCFVCGGAAPVVTRVTLVGDFGAPTVARISAVVPQLPEQFSSRVTAMSLGLTLAQPVVALGTEYVFSCEACATCAGSLFFEYNGAATSAIEPYSTSAAAVQAALQALATVDYNSEFESLPVEVESTHAHICDPSDDVTTRITLFGKYANVGELTLINSVRTIAPSGLSTLADAKLTATLSSPRRQASLAECSGNGICNRATGLCSCFIQKHTMNSSTGSLYQFGSSDGYGGIGTRPDCGYSEALPGHCFENCNGNGQCELSAPNRYRCVCAEGFTGPTCAQRTCPKATPWFGEPFEANNAHAGEDVECAAMGICDRASGRCQCREGFFGAACQYLDCPMDLGRNRCSGHGQCLSLRHLAQYAQAADGSALEIEYGLNEKVAWDADRIFGCLCDYRDHKQARNGPIGMANGFEIDNPTLSGYHGYDCSLRQCPVGDDPLSPGEFEIQTVSCSLTGTTQYTLQFRGSQTGAIPASASVVEIEAALNRLPTIGNVRVSYSTNLEATCDASGAGYSVTFLSEFGALPRLVPSDPEHVFVNRTVTGTKRELECAGRGICDFSTGLCSCPTTWHSSDSDGKLGTRGDCGYVDPYGH